MTKSLTHLEAFCSDDAKRGRVWTDGEYTFRRKGDWLFRSYETRGRTFEEEISAQVAVMEGEVRWTDEPKTLTPQEALRALADGECLQDDDVTVWVGFDGTFRGPNKDGVDGPVTIHRLAGFRIAPAHEPAPSQPAAPTKPTLKVGDRVRGLAGAGASKTGAIGSVIMPDYEPGWAQVKWNNGFISEYRYGADGKYDIEKIEAEPQVEYPLSYVDAMRASHEGAMMACDRYPGILFRYRNDREEAKCVHGCKGWHEGWGLGPGDQDSRWRIVEPATGGEG